MDAGRAALVAVRDSPRCNDCAYCSDQSERRFVRAVGREISDRYCEHPSATKIIVNAAYGIVRDQPKVTVSEARAPNGFCGPEGALFTKKGFPWGLVLSLGGCAAAVASPFIYALIT